MSEPQKTFHLAITMAGAISAGAYTAGVMDYLLEVLDKWYDLKDKADIFFDQNPTLKGKTWKELETIPQLSNETLKEAKRYNALPDHDIKIEILSGASAGGMTAAMTSYVLHQKNKHHVNRNSDEARKKQNRLYDSWVNLTGHDDMLPTLLSDDDITSIRSIDKNAPFPVSFFNSRFIREIAQNALRVKNHSNIKLSKYVAKDFNMFVTLTNLSGFAKSIKVDSGGPNYVGDFITFDHRDLMMFDFSEKPQKGIINLNFKLKKGETDFDVLERNTNLLCNAAVSTGAFPIGLEYGYIVREADYINHNPLLRKTYNLKEINGKAQLLVETDEFDHRAAFIDGGLINNEPFDLTRALLIDRLIAPIKEKILAAEPTLTDDELSVKAKAQLKAERFNRTTLMIDPFPSEKPVPSTAQSNGSSNQYPYSFMGAIGQLIAAMRTQLLVKAELLEKGFDEDDFECFLIAPRRRVYKTNAAGKPVKENGHYVSEFETKPNGSVRRGPDGNPIPKAFDGSAAIACGCLWGFGGFIDRSLREHDFYLGRINCKSFLRHHLRISEKKIAGSVFENSYTGEPENIFKIIEKSEDEKGKPVIENFYPIIPDVAIIDKIIDGKPVKYFQDRCDIDLLYGELDYPEYNMNKFRRHRKKLKKRLGKIMFTPLNMFLSPSLTAISKPLLWMFFHVWLIKWLAYFGICKIVEKELTAWQLINKAKPK